TAPRLIITGQPVEVGTSGGVTPAGMGAALAGAALIGLTAALFDFVAGQSLSSSFLLSLIAIVSGLAGSLVDSLLGATVQAIYFCERCGKETERHPLHSCGQPTRFLRGLRRLDNDWVNFLSSIAGTALAAGLWWIVAPV
ncbi:MAG: DUF92 domain-containing protein, partial [Anaerolineales bacterium]|nr:DUF92 domain-containing protein [Anaerolineales bacterium]